MRLLFVHDHRFHRENNGKVYTVGSFPQSVWRRYLAHFSRITVIARDAGPKPVGVDLARSDLPEITFKLVSSYPQWQRLLTIPGEAAKLINAEIAVHDALLVRLPSDLGNLASNIAKKTNVAWAAEAVGCAFDGYGNYGSSLSRVYAPLAMRRMQRAIAAAPQTIYVTRQFLQDRYPSQNRTAAVSDVEIESLGDDARKARLDRLQAINGGRAPKFGTVASLRTRSKGIQDAIAAIASLRDRGLDIEYRVLGAGDTQPWQALARENRVADLVHFDGTRPSGAGVRAWLDGIDVHCQPSYQEGLPRATIEAMSRGCACIGSTAGGLPELLPPDRLHAKGDISSLADLLRRLALDPAYVERAALADLETSASYQQDALATKRNDFYANLRDAAQRDG